MQSRTTRQFWRLLSGLPLDVQQDAKRAYRLFRSNPGILAFNSRNWKARIISIRLASASDLGCSRL
jgi:hypothetical protein